MLLFACVICGLYWAMHYSSYQISSESTLPVIIIYDIICIKYDVFVVTVTWPYVRHHLDGSVTRGYERRNRKEQEYFIFENIPRVVQEY